VSRKLATTASRLGFSYRKKEDVILSLSKLTSESIGLVAVLAISAKESFVEAAEL